MVLYRYRGKTPQGRQMEGTIDAPDPREAARVLRSRGLFVTSIVENREFGIPGERIRRPAARPSAEEPRPAMPYAPALPRRRFGLAGRASLKDLSLFCRQFGTMVGAGVSILTSLKILARQAASKRLRIALSQVAWSIEQGLSLSDAFRVRSDVFPPILVNMVAAGEAGGILEECFDRLAEHFEKEYAVAQKVRSAMAYPTVVSIAAIGVATFMVIFVLPNFIGIFQQIGADLPASTKFLLNLSNFLRGSWYLVFGAVVLFALSAAFWAGTPGGARFLDSLALRIPVFGDLILKRAVSRFARTLGTLMKSGVPLLICLSVVERTVGNRLVADAIHRAEDEIRSGRGIVAPLRDSRLFPQMVLEMMGVGEETGAMDQMLGKVADFYDKEIDATVQRVAGMIEPIVIIFVGAAIGFLLISLITPMFEIYNQLPT